MLFLVSPESEFMYANFKLLDALKLKEAELSKLNIYDIFSRNDEGIIRQAFISCIEKEESSPPLIVRLSKGDNYYTVSLFFVKDEESKSAHVAGTIKPKELNEISREQLQANALDFTVLADHIAQLAWMADAKGWIYWYNKRWFEYTGTTLEEMQGWGWKKVHHPDHVERVVTYIQQCWESGEVWEDLFPLRSANGEYRWFLSRAMPIRNENGEVIRWIGTNTDVTTQQLAEQELLDASIRKDEFIAILGHELRNPIATLMAAIDKPKDADDHWQQYDVMKRQIFRLKRLVDDLVDLSRLSRRKITLQVSNVDLSEQVKYCVETLQKEATAKKQHLHLSFPHYTLPVEGDPVRLQQAIQNIIQNAIKYSPEGKNIYLSCYSKDGYVFFECADEGPGLSPEQIPMVFEPFRQLYTVTDYTNTGLGIGLSLVKQLVSLHNGEVLLSSKEGEGSIFTIKLPQADTAANTEIPTQRDTIANTKKWKIMLAEDNEDLANLLKMQFERAGHEILEIVPNGEQVYDRVHVLEPQVVILDIGLPGKDGWHVAEELAASPIRSSFTLIGMSGFHPDPAKEHFFDKFILKPVQMSKLLATLER